MIKRPYHLHVPAEIKALLEREFSTASTMGNFLDSVGHIKEPIRSTITRPVQQLMNTAFVTNGKPNWRMVNAFKKTYEIRRGVRLPLTPDTILDESTVWALRSVVSRSTDYRALVESFPLQCEAQKNGYGHSSYACALYIFDILAEQTKQTK